MFDDLCDESDESKLRRLENKRNNQRFDYFLDEDDWLYCIVEYFPDTAEECYPAMSLRDLDEVKNIVDLLNKECEKKELYTMTNGRYNINEHRIVDSKQEKELTLDEVCRLLNGYDAQQVNLVGDLNKLSKKNRELDTKNTHDQWTYEKDIFEYKASLRSVLVKHMGDINLTEDQNQILIQVMNDLRNNKLIFE